MTANPIPLPRPVRESALDKIKRLEAEARDAAQQERNALIDRLAEDAGRCMELAEIKSLPAGQQDALRKLAAAIESGVQTIQSIGART